MEEPTMEEQVRLVQELEGAINRRNVVEDAYPSLEDLSVFLNGSPANREVHEQLWREYHEAVKKLDQAVSNKAFLAMYLRQSGQEGLALIVEATFQLPKLEY